MAQGEVLATVAGAETWTDGKNWTASRNFSSVERVAGGYRLSNIRKSFVTASGHASHFFFICRVEDAPQTDLTLLFVDRKSVVPEILEEWNGLGLRGNESSPMAFTGFVPETSLIGAEHAGMREATGFFQPVLALTYAAAYLGIGSGAFELALDEGFREHADGSQRLGSPVNQRRISEMAAQIEAAQTLLHSVAAAFDGNRLPSLLPVLQAKVICAETSVKVTEELMTIFGGGAFAARLPFERYFRDARAGLIMAIPNDTAYQQMAPMLAPK